MAMALSLGLIELIDIDKVLLFAVGVYEERSCVSIEFWPQNVACGIGDDGRCVSGWPIFRLSNPILNCFTCYEWRGPKFFGLIFLTWGPHFYILRPLKKHIRRAPGKAWGIKFFANQARQS